MARLPDSTALGERPVPVLPRRTPMVAQYHPTTGFEESGAQSMAHTSAEFEQAAHVVLQAKEQQDTLAAEDAYNKLRQTQIDLTYGPNGIVNQKGAAAMNRDLPAEYGGQLVKAADGLAKGLGNDNQRTMFARRAALSRQDVMQVAGHHQAHQSDVYANQVLEGTLDTESRVAAAGGDIQTSMLRMSAAIDRHAQRFGTAEQEVTALKMKAADSLWSSKIKAMVYTDPVAASALYKQHSAEIGPANRIVLEHEIHTTIRPIEAKAVAEAVLKGGTLEQDGARMNVGGEPAVQAVVSDVAVPGGVGYRAVTPAGTITEGTAPSEAEALKRVRLASGLPAKQAPSTALPTNTRDLRAQLAAFVDNGEKMAERLHPGDALFRDQVVSQIKGYVSTIAAAQEGIQRQAHGTLLTHLSGGPDGKTPKPTTMDELLALPGAREAYSHLDPGSLHGISAALQHNQIEAMGRAVKSNPVSYREARSRIYLPDGDERKITSPAQLTQFYAQDVTHPDIEGLRQELDQQMSISGRTFTADIETARVSAHRRFMTTPVGSIQPDKAEEAAYNFNNDLNKKIAEYGKTPGKDPRSLITPGSPDYMLTSERLASYMPSMRASVAAQAKGQLPKVASDADYEKLPAGSMFMDNAGRTWQKPVGKAPAATPKPEAYLDYIKAQPRSNSVEIDAAPKSVARALQGQKFESREAAINALKALYGGGG